MPEVKPGTRWMVAVVMLAVAVTAGLLVGTRGGVVTITRPQPFEALPVQPFDVENVSVDVELADAHVVLGDDVDVMVTNDFGRGIPDVQLDLTIEEPPGDFPEVFVRGGEEDCEDGAGKGDGVSLKEAAAKCEESQAEGDQWCKPETEPLEPGTLHSTCLRTLHPGNNRYLFEMALAVEEPSAEQIDGYPPLEVTIELSIDDEVFAEFSDELPSSAVNSD